MNNLRIAILELALLVAKQQDSVMKQVIESKLNSSNPQFTIDEVIWLNAIKVSDVIESTLSRR